jgi:hypothetical protein
MPAKSKIKAKTKSRARRAPASKPPMLVSFVLDETGSMQTIKAATIDGFNEFVSGLRKAAEPVLFTLVKFNSGKIETVYAGVPVVQVADLTVAEQRLLDSRVLGSNPSRSANRGRDTMS